MKRQTPVFFRPIGHPTEQIIIQQAGLACNTPSCGKGSYGEVYRLSNDDSAFKLMYASHPNGYVVKKINYPPNKSNHQIAKWAFRNEANYTCFRHGKSPRKIYFEADKPKLANTVAYYSSSRNHDYLLMPNLGKDLIKFLSEEINKPKDQKITLADLYLIFYKILSKLEKLHATGIVHNDIKPNNILILKKDDSFSVNLCDFGFSVDTNTSNNNFLGTVQYTAPERLTRKDTETDARKSDIYSFGMSCLHMLDIYLTKTTNSFSTGQIKDKGEVVKNDPDKIVTSLNKLSEFKAFKRVFCEPKIRTKAEHRSPYLFAEKPNKRPNTTIAKWNMFNLHITTYIKSIYQEKSIDLKTPFNALKEHQKKILIKEIFGIFIKFTFKASDQKKRIFCLVLKKYSPGLAQALIEHAHFLYDTTNQAENNRGTIFFTEDELQALIPNRISHYIDNTLAQSALKDTEYNHQLFEDKNYTQSNFMDFTKDRSRIRQELSKKATKNTKSKTLLTDSKAPFEEKINQAIEKIKAYIELPRTSWLTGGHLGLFSYCFEKQHGLCRAKLYLHYLQQPIETNNDLTQQVITLSALLSEYHSSQKLQSMVRTIFFDPNSSDMENNSLTILKSHIAYDRSSKARFEKKVQTRAQSIENAARLSDSNPSKLVKTDDDKNDTPNIIKFFHRANQLTDELAHEFEKSMPSQAAPSA